jgi:penicillin-binding protein 2
LRNHSLFVAFAPTDNPQIAIAVVAEHTTLHASEIARKVVDYYLLTEMHGKFNIHASTSDPQTNE